MFKILTYKKNTPNHRQYILPRNDSANPRIFIKITITNNEKFLVEKFSAMPEIVSDDWELKDNYAFPSALLTEFLRSDLTKDL